MLLFLGFCSDDYDTWFCGKKQYQRTERPDHQDMVSISLSFCCAILCRLQERKMNTHEYALIESTIALNVPIIDHVSYSLFLHVMVIYVLSLGRPAHKLSSNLNFCELQTFPHINASLVFQLLLSPHESKAQSVQAIVQVLLLLTFYVYVHLYLVWNRILESKLSARPENLLMKLNDRVYTSPVDAMTILPLYPLSISVSRRPTMW
jgi:hypothetical protein